MNALCLVDMLIT